MSDVLRPWRHTAQGPLTSNLDRTRTKVGQSSTSLEIDYKPGFASDEVANPTKHVLNPFYAILVAISLLQHAFKRYSPHCRTETARLMDKSSLTRILQLATARPHNYTIFRHCPFKHHHHLRNVCRALANLYFIEMTRVSVSDLDTLLLFINLSVVHELSPMNTRNINDI